MNDNTSDRLRELQSEPLFMKEISSEKRIFELVYEYGNNFYVSFSGGKDSAVAVDFTAKCLKKLGFSKMYVLNINTGLEYLAVQQFCEPFCEMVSEKYGLDVILDTVYPEMRFVDVLIQYGYPLISKEVSQCIYEARKGRGTNKYISAKEKLAGTHRDKNGKLSPYNIPQYQFLLNSNIPCSHICCKKTKHGPAFSYEKATGRIPLVATTCQESRARRTAWLRYGCNYFETDRPRSAPFSTWLENDMLTYIKQNRLPLASVYGDVVLKNKNMPGQISLFDQEGYDGAVYETTGCPRTGCLFCLFGITQDRERILRLQNIEPHRADYVLRGGKFNSQGMWTPTLGKNGGLGYWYILDFLKEHGIYVPYRYPEKYRRDL